MVAHDRQEFEKEVFKLFNRLKEDTSKLWPNAIDNSLATQERLQVVSAGLVAFDNGYNREYIQYFDKNYKLGVSIHELTTKITDQASQQEVEYIPDEWNETEYLSKFRSVMPTVILSNRQNILATNVKEIGDLTVVRTFFIELYALRRLSELHQKGNGSVKSLKQMEWLGTQKELAELHVELEAKGWIKKFDVNTIKSAYTKSDTLHQVMKSNESVKMGDQVYDQIYTTKYKPMFYAIKPNLQEK